jgi:hypothetical protein
MAYFKGIGGADVEADATPKALRAVLYDQFGRPLGRKHGAARDEANDEALLIAGVNDGNIRHFRTDRTGGQAVALNSLLFNDPFEGAVINANKWLTTGATMTVTQVAATGMVFNAGNSVATGVGQLARGLRTIMRPMRSIVQAKFRLRAEHYTGAVFEAGFGDASTFNGAHSNGAYLQVAPDGVVALVWMYNTVPLTSAPIVGLNAANYYTADIIMDDDQVVLIVQDTVTGLIVAERNIFLPSTAPKQSTSSRLFPFARHHHTAVPPTAPKFTISSFDVLLLDNMQNKEWFTTLASLGQEGSFHPSNGAQTTQWANSAAPASAALSNTVPGYGATIKDGLFQFAAALGATTDYVLFGFQVPAPYSFHCTGVDIDAWNLGAAVAGTPTTLVWGLGVNQAAASLATAGIVRTPLGAQSFPVGALIGAKAERLPVTFDAPKITDAGRFMTLILRMPSGTATASQIIQGCVSFKGAFE